MLVIGPSLEYSALNFSENGRASMLALSPLSTTGLKLSAHSHFLRSKLPGDCICQDVEVYYSNYTFQTCLM